MIKEDTADELVLEGEGIMVEPNHAIANISALYFLFSLLAKSQADTAFGAFFASLTPLFGWFVFPEMLGWGFAAPFNLFGVELQEAFWFGFEHEGIVEYNDYYIDDYHFGYDITWAGWESNISLATAVRNAAFLVCAAEAGYFDFDGANWIAVILGAAYTTHYSYARESEVGGNLNGEPLKILGEPVDFWLLMFYVIFGTLDYVSASAQ